MPKPGAAARRGNGVWRVHSAFDVPAERFAFFEVTEEGGGERFDRITVAPGEIRIADRADRQPERIAAVRAAGGDVVVRCGWRNAAWRDAAGEPFDMIAALCQGAEPGLIDRPIRVRRRGWSLSRNRRKLPKQPAARRGARRKRAATNSPKRPWWRPIG